MPGLGKESYLQVGTETVGVWGTPVASTQKLEVVDNSFEPVAEFLEDPSLWAGFSARDLIQVGISAAGTIKHRANYEGQLQQLRAFFGGYSTSAITGGRDHFFIEADQRSLTLQDIRGNLPANQCWQLPGVRYSKMEFDCQNKQLATLSFDGVAKDMIPAQTPTGSLGFPAVFPVKFQHADPSTGAVADGSGDSAPLNLQGIKVTSERALDVPTDIGSLNIQEPDLSAMTKTTWELTYRMKSVSAASFLRAGTTSTLDIKWQDPATFGSGSHREWQLTSNNCKCIGFKPPIRGYGRILLTVVWQAFYEATSATGLQLRVRNTEAALS